MTKIKSRDIFITSLIACAVAAIWSKEPIKWCLSAGLIWYVGTQLGIARRNKVIGEYLPRVPFNFVEIFPRKNK